MNLSATIVIDTQNASALDALRGNVDGLKQQLGALQAMFSGLRSETMRPLVTPGSTSTAADGLKQIGTEATKTTAAVKETAEALQLRAAPAAARKVTDAIKEVTVAARQAGAAGEEANRKLRLRAPAPAARAPLRLGYSFGLDDQRNAEGLRPRALLRLPEWANVRGRVTMQDMTGPGIASARGNIASLRQGLQGLQMVGAGLRGGGLMAATDGVNGLASGLARVAPAAGAAALALAPLAVAGALVAAGLPKASEMEDLEVSLATLIGSTQAAKQRLDEDIYPSD